MNYTRGQDGKISGGFANPQKFDPARPGVVTTEDLPDDHPDVTEWKAARAAAPPRDILAELDELRGKVAATEVEIEKLKASK